MSRILIADPVDETGLEIFRQGGADLHLLTDEERPRLADMLPDFDALVVEIIRRHAPDLRESAVKTRPSKGGNWISVTVTIEATSKSQLDAIYQSLTDHEKVVMAL